MTDVPERLEKMTSTLKEAGLRLTPQRLAVLKILAESKGHPSAEQVYEQVRKDFPTTSLATIYKTVTLLKSMNQVLELGFADSGSRYDGNKPYPHPHVICTKCGKIVDPEFDDMNKLARLMAQQTGYNITNHRLDFFGLCPACQSDH